MNRITAKMLYNDVKEMHGGIYVWLDPDEESLLHLQKLMKGAPFKTYDSTEVHCTVLHCSSELPEDLDVPEDRQLPAEVNMLDVWDDHKGRKILVARLGSDELHDLHAALTGQGLTHSFDDYTPHITLGKDLKLDAETRLWIEQVNHRLADEALFLWFAPELKATALG